MSQLHLPTEVLRLIVEHYYEPWSIHIRKLQVVDGGAGTLNVSGCPPLDLLLTCHTLHVLAAEAEIQSFSGTMYVEETLVAVTCCNFMDLLKGTPRYKWVQDNVRTVSFIDPTSNTWSFGPELHWELFPNIQRAELNCR